MKAEFLQPAEYDLWNQFVDTSPQGDVFCYTWWLKAVTRDDFKILVVRENHQVAAGIILPFYSTGRINEPYLTRTGGVLYKTPDKETPRNRLSMERRWLKALLDGVDIRHVVQMCLHHNFTDWLLFRWHGYRQTTRYTYLFDFGKTTPGDIWRNMARSQRRTIQKAARNGIHVEEGGDMALVYNFTCLSYQRQHKKFPYGLSDLQRLDNAIQEHGKRAIFKAMDGQNAIHAVFYAVYNEKSAYCLMSGGDPALRSKGGHTLVIWEAIRYFSDKVALLNFGGSDIQPIEEHLRSFGGAQAQYFHLFNEALVSADRGFRYHGGQMLYHGREICREIRRRPLREYPVLFCNMLKALSGAIKKRLHPRRYA